jgi:hypothetical protein
MRPNSSVGEEKRKKWHRRARGPLKISTSYLQNSKQFTKPLNDPRTCEMLGPMACSFGHRTLFSRLFEPLPSHIVIYLSR